MLTLIINGEPRKIDTAADTPLLWILRDELGLTGTKYSCGIAACGACTVLVDNRPVRSCVVSAADVTGKQIVTVEGLAAESDHPVQRAWTELDVPQCGFCQSGQILSAVALLAANPDPSDADIDEAMSGVLCRCGTYQRVRHAIKRAATMIREGT